MKLKLRDVEFCYKNGPAVLEDIKMTVGANQMLTILGPNGVGKTTLL
ncbi:MAG: cobalt ABC transporter, partial [Candidatus Bathyarchaeum sp.]